MGRFVLSNKSGRRLSQERWCNMLLEIRFVLSAVSCLRPRQTSTKCTLGALNALSSHIRGCFSCETGEHV